MRYIYLALIFALFNSAFASGPGADEKIPDVPVEFSSTVFTAGDKTYLALHYKNYPHWHTYWKNPGDAGLAIKAQIQKDGASLELTELEWPAPSRYIENGNLWAYGYEGEYSLFYEFPVTQTRSGNYKINSTWLVCKHICIPGKGSTEFVLTGNEDTVSAGTLEVSGSEITRRLEALPAKKEFPANLDLVLTKGEKPNTLTFYYTLTGLEGAKAPIGRNVLTPFLKAPFNFGHEELAQDKSGNLYGRMMIEWDGEYQEPVIPFPQDGKFQKAYNLAFLYTDPKDGSLSVIEKSFPSFQTQGLSQMQSFFSLLKVLPLASLQPKKEKSAQGEEEAGSETSKSEDKKGLLYFLLMAFLGGLILNLMPCVLPVISLKLFGLIQHSRASRSEILKHNLLYSAGVISCFLLLAGAVLLLKQTGESVGWGFQLQSPVFVSLMILVLFLFALNLFGLFEFQTPGGQSLGSVKLNEGAAGDFFGGVLATILSTPCSAPFLGTALTFAFTSGTSTIFLVFTFIGIGLAFPFLLTGFFPAALKVLPKPGAWMEHLKKFLGLTLLLTVIWLVDVYLGLTPSNLNLLYLLTVMTFTFFALYAWKNIFKGKLFKVLFLLIPLGLYAQLVKIDLAPAMPAGNKAGSELLRQKQMKGLNWEKWSRKAMGDFQSQGQWVFMDFTAKWCFTCKVNEKLVLETDGFKNLVSKYNLKLLLADWTKRDDIIGSFLKENGMVGVPAYFIQKPDGTLLNLGETITLSKIESYLK